MGERLTIGEVCNRTVVYATESMSLKQAAGLMRDEHVGCLVVAIEAEGGRIATGMVTDRDIAVVAVARDFDPQTLSVGDIMSRELVTARPEESIYDVLHKMRRHGIRRMPVTSDNGSLIGIVTLDDLLEIVVDELQCFVQAMTKEQQREKRVRV